MDRVVSVDRANRHRLDHRFPGTMTTYLDVPFREKDAAKALGARWGPAARKWYAPAGVELTRFDAWLPASAPPVAPAVAAPGRVAGAAPAGRELAPATKGILLSQLLAGIAQAIAQAYHAGVWTRVEVVEARTHNGHVYLQVTERTPDGRGGEVHDGGNAQG